jgi:hypothetical protein
MGEIRTLRALQWLVPWGYELVNPSCKEELHLLFVRSTLSIMPELCSGLMGEVNVPAV